MKSPRRILVITLSNVGDVIMTTPVISALHQMFPEASLTVVAGPKGAEILRGSRIISRLLVYDKWASMKQKANFLKELARDSYDAAVDLRNTALPFFLGIPKKSSPLRRFKSLNMRRRHLEILDGMGWKAPETIPCFDFFGPAEQASALGILRDLNIRASSGWILLAPAAASELKTWRFSGFKELLLKFLAAFPHPVFLAGDERERSILEPLQGLDGARVFNLAGRTTLPELAALTSRASLVVANDSALAHLGFELGVPVVALFGPTHPGKFGHEGPGFRIVRRPLFCSPCQSPVCLLGARKCLDDLDPETVWQACREVLNERFETRVS